MKYRFRSSRFMAVVLAALASILAGGLAVSLPVGERLWRWSFDHLFLFRTASVQDDVVIVYLNEVTDAQLGRAADKPLDRSHHAELLKRLTSDGAATVCYDILFDRPSVDPGGDVDFAAAMRSHGHVVLGGSVIERNVLGAKELVMVPPIEFFRESCEAWGCLNIGPADADGVVRRYTPQYAGKESLAVACAVASGAEVRDLDNSFLINFTLPSGGIKSVEFSEALDSGRVPPSFFRNKTVFVGGMYSTTPDGDRDSHRTPFSRMGYPNMFGVEIHAQAYQNVLRRGDPPLKRASDVSHWVWMTVFALLLMPTLYFRRLWIAVSLVPVVALLFTAVVIYVQWNHSTVWTWIVPLALQAPIFLCVIVVFRVLAPRFVLVRNREIEGPVDVFISCASDDEDFAAMVKGSLDSLGITSFFYKERLRFGTHWTAEIARAIRNSSKILFLMSKGSCKSRYCQDELRLAYSCGKPIFTIRMAPVDASDEIALLVKGNQRIDGWDKSPEAILAAICEVVMEKRGEHPPQPGKSDDQKLSKDF